MLSSNCTAASSIFFWIMNITLLPLLNVLCIEEIILIVAVGLGVPLRFLLLSLYFLGSSANELCYCYGSFSSPTQPFCIDDSTFLALEAL
jgi:hypothetical protein